MFDLTAIVKEKFPDITIRNVGNDSVRMKCPFHDEKTASCFIKLSTGQFYCFGCHLGGGIKTFLKSIGITRDKIEELTKDIIFVPHQSKLIPHVDIFKAKTLLSENVLIPYKYRPDYLINKGYDEKLLWNMEVGFDRKRNRIIYPIRDVYGNLVGVSGGTIVGADPKYKVYRGGYNDNKNRWICSDYGKWFDEQYPAYGTLDKENYIWNYDRVYSKVLHSKIVETIYVVEGFKACLWMMQCGIFNTIALLGSNLTEPQSILLKRLKAKYIICLDNDAAGIRGTKKAVEDLKKIVKVETLNWGKYKDKHQPDDLSKEEIERIETTCTT